MCFHTLYNIPPVVKHYAIYYNKTIHISSCIIFAFILCTYLIKRVCVSQITCSLFFVFDFHCHAEGH